MSDKIDEFTCPLFTCCVHEYAPQAGDRNDRIAAVKSGQLRRRRV